MSSTASSRLAATPRPAPATRSHSARCWTAIAIVSGIAGAVGYLVADTLALGDGGYVQPSSSPPSSRS
jgi:hypothetical protein